MQAQIRRLVGAIVLVLGIPKTVYPERYVVVNNNRLNDSEIMVLERWHCGPFPNGYYWLNTNNGLWGYADDPGRQGYITDNCYNPARRPGLSERGMLFYLGELAK